MLPVECDRESSWNISWNPRKLSPELNGPANHRSFESFKKGRKQLEPLLGGFSIAKSNGSSGHKYADAAGCELPKQRFVGTNCISVISVIYLSGVLSLRCLRTTAVSGPRSGSRQTLFACFSSSCRGRRNVGLLTFTPLGLMNSFFNHIVS